MCQISLIAINACVLYFVMTIIVICLNMVGIYVIQNL